MNDNVLSGIKCPKCGSLGPFTMALKVYAYAVVTDDGWDDLRTVESEFAGPASCLECRHEWDVHDLTDEELSDLLSLAESLNNEADEESETDNTNGGER